VDECEVVEGEVVARVAVLVDQFGDRVVAVLWQGFEACDDVVPDGGGLTVGSG
jgi:hypothetical protein